MVWLRSNAREEQGKVEKCRWNTGVVVVWLRLDAENCFLKIDVSIDNIFHSITKRSGRKWYHVLCPIVRCCCAVFDVLFYFILFSSIKLFLLLLYHITFLTYFSFFSLFTYSLLFPFFLHTTKYTQR